MHKIAIIVNVDNDTCAYIDGKLCAGNLKYISFDNAQGGKPHLLYALDERVSDSGADLKSFLYLMGCILQGWDSVESAQPKNLTWFDALKQVPMETFANTVFEMCQIVKDGKSFEASLKEKLPEEIAPALHLMNTGAISLIPGYGQPNSGNSHWDSDNEKREHE